MKRHPVLSSIVLLGFAVGLFFWTRPAPSQASAATAPAATPAVAVSAVPQYGTCTASSDGIGKTYQGREIAQVMGHPGIGWLERTEREKEEAPSKAIAALKLAPDAVVADLGAGSGYYTFRLAPLVPQGRVVAIDIQPEMLAYMNEEMRARGVKNVQPHLGSVTELKLPDASLDAVLMVDAYHEFDHPAEMLSSMKAALKKGGRIYLLEFRAEDPKVPIKTHHKMSEAQARKELEAAGFRFLENRPDLPWQHLMVFEKS
jgi:SAM-dependent methyltransferase